MLPKAEDVIREKVNALLDQLGCSVGTDYRRLKAKTYQGDGITNGFVILTVMAQIDVQSFQALNEPPPGGPQTREGG